MDFSFYDANTETPILRGRNSYRVLWKNEQEMARNYPARIIGLTK